ncbi:hypothetical protein BLNAU_4303 [Blattamonas nauphoetae]|uniref:Protein kinase domain-containing protein n=1 Tax=Blattamonas nauphoetae TaxID=2049346 RepID=A0ABQ9YA53_9EUKA|nr:hypothetical protein BLNAU_4303 [Blattamonas nauphoetae]
MLPATFMESATNTLIITETVVSSERQIFGGMCHFKDMDSQSSSASVTISASSLQDHRITSCDSFILRFDSPPAKQALSSISSTISAVLFNNITSTPSNTHHTTLKLSQVMHGCSVTQTNNHLSGSTIRDFNSGGSLLCQNTSFTNIHTANTELEAPTDDDPANYQFVGKGDEEFLASKTLENVGPVAFTKCSFSNLILEDPSRSAAAIAAKNIKTSFLLDQCKFTEISSSGTAGAVFISGTDTVTPIVEIRSGEFTNCSTSFDNGGGVNIQKASYVTISDTSFNNCTAKNLGGGLRVSSASTASFNDLKFGSCQAGNFGGGMHIVSITTTTMTSCEFSDCVLVNLASDASTSDTPSDSDTQRNQEDLSTTDPDEPEEPEDEEEEEDPATTEAPNGGGVFFKQSVDITCTLCIFVNCTSSYDGGGIGAINNNGAFKIDNCSFCECKSDGYGGGARLHRIGSVEIRDVVFNECRTGHNGAGLHIFVIWGPVSLDNVTFSGCVAGGDAGAMKISTSTELTIKNTTVSSCSATLYAGGIYALLVKPGKIVVENCTFESCHGGWGGGLRVSESDEAEITTTFFINCSTDNSAGGCCVANMTKSLLQNCTFEDCQSVGLGGAIFVSQTGTIEVNTVIMKNCSSETRGGGFAGRITNTTIIDSCTIENCTGGTFGGGIKTEYLVDLTITRTTISRCSANTDNGGGIHHLSLTGKLVFSHNVVEHCSAINNSGAAVFSIIPVSEFTNNTIENCSATNFHGGGLRLSNLHTLTLSDCRFISCKAGTHGGGLFVENSTTLTLSGITARGCQATYDGSGVYVNLDKFTQSSSLTVEGLVLGGKEVGEANVIGRSGSDLYFVISSTHDRNEWCEKFRPFACQTPFNTKSFNLTERTSIEFGTSRSNTITNVGSILYVLHPYTSGVLVLDDTLGEDHALCGNTTLPCSTLLQSNTHASSKSDGVVSLRTNLAINADLTISKSVGWTSESAKRTITQTGDCSISVSTGTLTASKLSFAVSAASYSKSFFVVNGGSLALSACSFDSIASTSPIIHATLSASNRLSITKTTDTDITTLNSCSSSSSALIHLSLTSPNKEDDWTFDLSGLSFSSAQSNSESAGQRIFVNGSHFSTQIVPARFPSVTKNDEYLLWGMDTSTTVNCSLLVYLIAIGSTVSVGGTPSAGIVECGHFGVSCPTLQRGFNRVSSLGSDLTISVNGTFVHNTTFQVQTPISLSMQSNTSTQTITTSSAGCLEVTNGALTIKDLTFTGTSRSTSFITVSNLGQLSVDSCTLSGFESTSANGVAIQASLTSSGSSLTLNAVTFQSCSSARGGALFLHLGEGSLVFTTVPTFTSCTAKNEGQHIYATTPSTDSGYSKLAALSSLVQSPQNAISFTPAEKSLIEFGTEAAGVITHIGSILYFYHPYSDGSLALDNTNGDDHALCGNTTLPCRGLSTASTIAGNAASGVVSLRTKVAIDATLTISKSVGWTSESTKRTITQTGDCSISVSTGTLTASKLSFAVSAASYSKSFFVVNGGSLALSACSFDSIASTSPIIHATLSASNRLSITKTTDTDITTLNSCSSSSSALIHLSLTSPNKEVAWTFDLSGLSFSSAQSNSESAGQRIFVNGSHFSTQIVPARFPSVTKNDEYLLWGMDTSTTVNCSLLVYLIAIGSTVSVGGTPSAGIVECGHFGVSCPTLQRGFNRVSSLGSDLTISVNGTFVHNTTFQVQTPISLSMQSNTSTQTITTSSAGCLEVTNGALTIKDLTFTGTSRSTSFITVSNLGQLSVDSCTLSGFESTSANGVAIQASLTSSGSSLTLNAVTFQSCSSARGGALFLHLGEGSLVFTTVPTFVSCSATEGKHIYATTPSTDPGYSKLAALSSLVQSPQNAISFTPAEKSLIEFGTEAAGVVTHIDIPVDGDNGADHPLCGHSTLPCASLSSSYPKIPTTHTILVRSHSSLSSIVTTVDKAITIKSSTNVAQKLTVSGTGGFEIASGSLHINLLSITIPSAHPNSFASVSTNGHLTLEACSVKSVILTDSPFISHVGGNLTLTNCQFSSITRHTGNGSVLFSDMQVATSLKINGLNLSSVATKNGKVDGLHIIFPRSETPSEAPTFTLKNIRYDHLATTSNVETSFVWIVGEYFSRWVEINDDRFKGSFESSTIENEWLWAEDTTDDLSISMLFYLKERTGPIGVEKDGMDREICGYFSLWCRSFEHSLKRMKEMITSQMNVMTSVDLDKKFTLEDSIHIHGKESPSQLSVTGNGHLECTGNELFRFDYLQFSLMDGLTSQTVLSIQRGRLVIEDSSLVSASTFGKTFLTVQHGQAEIVRFVVTANIEESGKMIVSDQGNVTLTSLSFPSSLKTFGTIAQTTGGDLSIDTAVFASLSFTTTPFLLSSTATTFSKVNVSGCTIDEFITASQGSVSLQDCVFEGSSTPANNEEDICEWVSGIFNLTECSTDCRHTEFKRFPQGVFNIKEGSLTLTNSDFFENHAGNTSFPSVQRNIHCEGNGMIKFLQSATNTETISRWISTTDCAVKENTETIDTPFFIPTLDTNKTKSTSSSSQYTLSIVGTLLVPCQLFLEVFENTATKSTDVTVGSIAPVQLTEDNTKNWAEQSTTVTVPVSLLSTLNQSFELRARLSVGSYTTDSIRVKLSRNDERKAHAKEAMAWLIPLVSGLLVLLLFLFILFVLLRRHKKKQQAKNVQKKELGEMDAPIEIKFEAPDDFLATTNQHLIHSEPDHDIIKNDVSTNNEDTHDYTRNDDVDKPAAVVKALRCGDENLPEVFVSERETLYNRLHRPANRSQPLDKTVLKKKLTQSLAMVANTHPSSPVLSKLTSHWVMFDVDGELCLRLAEPAAHRQAQTHSQPNHMSTQKNTNGVDEEGQRWVPPEMANGQQIIDVTHGTVFRLGLILWEIETEQIPFGEVDGINAQRQLGIGILPKMDKVDEEMKDIITKCLQVDPLKRPTLLNLANEFNPPKGKEKNAGECFKEPSPDLEGLPPIKLN